MEQAGPDERLSRIETHWTAVFQAHGSTADGARDARHQLMSRYGGAAYRYLLGAVRDPDVASDLCQEFAVRFLRGDFRRADPEKGRFRDFVKTSLFHLIVDYQKKKRHQPREFSSELDSPLVHPPETTSSTDSDKVRDLAEPFSFDGPPPRRRERLW